MQVLWQVGERRLALDQLDIELVDGRRATASDGDVIGRDWWGVGWAEPVENVPVVRVDSAWYHTPRFVDELSYEEHAVPVTEPRSVMRLAAQLADRRRWSSEGVQPVNDDMAILTILSATGHVLVVKAWRAGYYEPRALGDWQRHRMERYEPEAVIDLGGHHHDRGEYDSDDAFEGDVREDLAQILDEGSELAFKWAAQLQQQLAYDLEGTGWDGQGDHVKWDDPTRLKAPSSLTPRPGRHPGWDRPPSAWTVRRLPATRAYQRSPFAGMAHRGTDPHRWESGHTAD